MSMRVLENGKSAIVIEAPESSSPILPQERQYGIQYGVLGTVPMSQEEIPHQIWNLSAS